MLLPKEAQKVLEESVYEYQHWSVFTKWEALVHPGR